MTDEELKQEVDKVLEAEFGIELKVNDPVSFRRRFYSLRVNAKAAGDNALDSIMCRIMSSEIIHLVHKGARDATRGLGKSNDTPDEGIEGEH